MINAQSTMGSATFGQVVLDYIREHVGQATQNKPIGSISLLCLLEFLLRVSALTSPPPHPRNTHTMGCNLKYELNLSFL